MNIFIKLTFKSTLCMVSLLVLGAVALTQLQLPAQLVFAADSNVIAADSAAEPSKSAAAKSGDTGSGALQVELVNAAQADGESAGVIAALQKLLQALAQRDLQQVDACLSDDVTVYDDRNRRYIYGRETVVEHVKNNVIGADGEKPVKRLVIYDPFIYVKGNTAMVSFRATKELGGDSGLKLESWCSEIFERKNGQWLVLQLRTSWRPIKDKG